MSAVAAVAALAAGLAVLLAAGGGRPTRRLRAVRAQVRHGPEPGHGGPRGTAPGADLPVDLVLELVAGLLDAGAPARQAVVLVEQALAGQVPAGQAQVDDGAARRVEGVAEVVALSESSGLPAAALLRARADDLRRERAAAHGRAVRRLGVQLVLPMGLCLLPAFVLLGVVPVVADLLGGM